MVASSINTISMHLHIQLIGAQIGADLARYKRFFDELDTKCLTNIQFWGCNLARGRLLLKGLLASPKFEDFVRYIASYLRTRILAEAIWAYRPRYTRMLRTRRRLLDACRHHNLLADEHNHLGCMSQMCMDCHHRNSQVDGHNHLECMSRLYRGCHHRSSQVDGHNH